MTKASQNRRRRKLERRGRPTGSFKSLFKDPQRFSAAAWLTLEPLFGPHTAARAVTVWLEERTPITIQTVEDSLVMISADFAAPGDSDLTDHGRELARKSRLVASRATDREFAWLTQSSGALTALITSHVRGDVLGVEKSIAILRCTGWSEVIDRARGRLDKALYSNFPPIEAASLSQAATRLLAAMRSKNVPES